MSSEKSSAANPPGFVPFYGQGLRAKESQLGAVGTKEWLKSIKLHKYWPLISHWSYWQMLALTEDNIEYNIKMVGGTEITRGAQGKLLRSIEELRQRKPRLKKTIENLGSCRISLEAELSYIWEVIFTPFPTSEEDSLPTLVVYTVQKIKEYITLNGNSLGGDRKLDRIVRATKQNPVLNKADNHLKQLPLLWEIQEAIAQHAFRSSRILPHILRERNRNCSVDSGFEENLNVTHSTKQVLSVWPIGKNKVMFESPKGNKYKKLLQHSPFYPNEDEEKFDEKETNTQELG